MNVLMYSYSFLHTVEPPEQTLQRGNNLSFANLHYAPGNSHTKHGLPLTSEFWIANSPYEHQQHSLHPHIWTPSEIFFICS